MRNRLFAGSAVPTIEDVLSAASVSQHDEADICRFVLKLHRGRDAEDDYGWELRDALQDVRRLHPQVVMDIIERAMGIEPTLEAARRTADYREAVSHAALQIAHNLRTFEGDYDDVAALLEAKYKS